MKPVINSIKFIAMLGLVFFFQSCQNDDDATLPEIEASFTHNINESTGLVTFLNTSENADTYSWTFGDGSTSTEINPQKVYGTGTYNVVLTARNSAGATDTFEDVININIPIPVSLPFNFDGANVVYNYTVFNGATFAIVDNPAPGGSNPNASMVGEITNSGVNWEGMFFDLANQIDMMVDMTIKIDFWSSVPVDVLLKLEEGTGANVETTASHTGSSDWEELTFTFNSTDKFSRMTLFVDGPGTAAGPFYFDNVRQTATVDLTIPVITLVGSNPLNLNVGDTYTDPGATAMDNTDGDITANIVVGGDTVDTSIAGTYVVTYNVMDAAGNAAVEVTRDVIVSALPTAPSMGAPIPTHPAADVISIYSDTYTDIGIADFDPNWGQSGHTQVDPNFDPGDGNLALSYPNFNYQGTQFAGTEDMSTMEFLHIDMWTPDATDVKVTPISAGTGEFLVGLTPITTGQWNSYDIPLTDFTGMMFNDLIQMKFDGQGGTNPSNIFLDNIYFYRTSPPPSAPTMGAPTPVHAGADVMHVYSDYYDSNGGTAIPVGNFDPNWGQSGHTQVNASYDPGDGNLALHYPNFNYQGTELTSSDISGMDMVHIDLWTLDATDVKFTPISASSGEFLVGLSPITSGQWNSYDIPLSDFTGVALTDIIQLKFDGQGGTNPSNIWLDNIYFYSSGSTGGAWTTADPVDFESAGYGASWTWNVFENVGNAPLEFVANPDPSGANTSSTVAKITALTGGEPWAGTEVAHGQIGPFIIDGSTQIIKIMVYKSVISDVGIKLVNTTNGASPEIKVANTVINQWEELSFDFSGYVGDPAAITTDLDQIVVFPDFDLAGRTTDNVVYFDNIVFTN